VKEMTTRATDVLTDYTYYDKPRERRRSAICNMTGSDIRKYLIRYRSLMSARKKKLVSYPH
jgi:hypothetical protein